MNCCLDEKNIPSLIFVINIKKNKKSKIKKVSFTPTTKTWDGVCLKMRLLEKIFLDHYNEDYSKIEKLRSEGKIELLSFCKEELIERLEKLKSTGKMILLSKGGGHNISIEGKQYSKWIELLINKF